MIANILSIVILAALFYLLVSLPVGLFNMRVFQAVNGTKCTGYNRLGAFVPLANITFARKLVYRRTFWNYILILCAALLLFRIISILTVAYLPVLIVYSSMSTIFCIALYFVLYILNALDFCRLLNCGIVTIVCCIAAPPVGYYMISTQVLRYFKSVEDDVSGRFGT
jgi:hypothetical protein